MIEAAGVELDVVLARRHAGGDTAVLVRQIRPAVVPGFDVLLLQDPDLASIIPSPDPAAGGVNRQILGLVRRGEGRLAGRYRQGGGRRSFGRRSLPQRFEDGRPQEPDTRRGQDPNQKPQDG